MTDMRHLVRRVMDYIHETAYERLAEDEYTELLECIEYEIDQELEGEWPAGDEYDPDSDW